jgi:hypothetical protein
VTVVHKKRKRKRKKEEVNKKKYFIWISRGYIFINLLEFNRLQILCSKSKERIIAD